MSKAKAQTVTDLPKTRLTPKTKKNLKRFGIAAGAVVGLYLVDQGVKSTVRKRNDAETPEDEA